MPRKPTIKSIQKKLTRLVAEKVKERDKGVCQWCGKPARGSNGHISHVVPKSSGNRLRWDLLNLKLLCFHCHIHVWHKHPVKAGEWFKAKFPERWEYLKEREHEVVKWKVSDYQKMIENLV